MSEEAALWFLFHIFFIVISNFTGSNWVGVDEMKINSPSSLVSSGYAIPKASPVKKDFDSSSKITI